MKLMNGYEFESTFWEDFSIADAFGVDAITNTYKRAFEEWKDNYVYLTELVCTLNLKIWQHYETNPVFGSVYNRLWSEADTYACNNLTGDEAKFFFRITD